MFQLAIRQESSEIPLPAPNWFKNPLTLWLKLLPSKKSARPANFAALLQDLGCGLQEMMSIQRSAVKKYDVINHWTAKLSYSQRPFQTIPTGAPCVNVFKRINSGHLPY